MALNAPAEPHLGGRAPEALRNPRSYFAAKRRIPIVGSEGRGKNGKDQRSLGFAQAFGRGVDCA